jgi:hypothetical protein
MTIDDKIPNSSCMNTGKDRYGGICKSCDGTYQTAKRISCDNYFSRAKHDRINRKFVFKMRVKIRDYNDLGAI